MTNPIQEISDREFKQADIILGNIKNGKPRAFECSCKAKDFKKSFEKLRGVLRE